jgi:siroheme synthase
VYELLVLVLLGGGVAWVASGLKARELAVARARLACQQAGVQFLDDTVSAAATALARDDAGRLCLRRAYRFEYSRDGASRETGIVRLLAGRIESCSLERLWLVDP